MWMFGKKITGKSKEKIVFGKGRGRGRGRQRLRGKTIKRMGPGGAVGVYERCFGLPELYRKAYNTDKPVLVCVGRKP